MTIFSPFTKLKNIFSCLMKKYHTRISLYFICVVLLCAIFGPIISSHGYREMNIPLMNRFWDRETLMRGYLLGTDGFGRDLFVRWCYGARISLLIALFAILIEATLGSIYGGVSGYAGGKIDFIMMKTLEVFSGVPNLLYLAFLVVLIGPGVKTIVISMAVNRWMTMATIVRSEVMKIKEKEYVQASYLLGGGVGWVLLIHLLPNIFGQILVRLIAVIPSAIFYEAFLSFMGIGIRPPFPSWGQMLVEGFKSINTFPHIFIISSLSVSLTVLSLNTIGDELKNLFNSRIGD